MNDSKLTYFTRSEFVRNDRDWFNAMCPSLLVRLDVLRNMWGAPIILSPHPDAIGREDDTDSQHNIRKWGEVRAVDVFFDVPTHYKEEKLFDQQFINTLIANGFKRHAEYCNFSGIGIYPQWTYKGKRRTGFHLDTGNRKATWSRINGKYLDFESGIKWMEYNGTD